MCVYICICVDMCIYICVYVYMYCIMGMKRIELRRLRKMCAKINEYISNNAINEMKVIYVKELDNRAKLETRLEDFFKHVGQSGRLFIEQKSEHRDRGRITWHFNRAQQDLVQRDRADPTHGRLEDSATSSTCNLNLSIGQSMNESGAVHGPDVCRGQSPADEKLINFSCCRCNQTFRSKSAHSRHRNTCLAIPGAVYDFLRLKITQTFKQPITEMKKEWTEYILEPLKKLSYPCTLDKYKKTLKISVFKRLEDCGIGRRNFIMMMCMEMPAHFNALADEEDYTNLNPCPTNHDDPFNSLNSNAHNSNLNDAKAVPIPNRIPTPSFDSNTNTYPSNDCNNDTKVDCETTIQNQPNLHVQSQSQPHIHTQPGTQSERQSDNDFNSELPPEQSIHVSHFEHLNDNQAVSGNEVESQPIQQQLEPLTESNSMSQPRLQLQSQHQRIPQSEFHFRHPEPQYQNSLSHRQPNIPSFDNHIDYKLQHQLEQQTQHQPRSEPQHQIQSHVECKQLNSSFTHDNSRIVHSETKDAIDFANFLSGNMDNIEIVKHDRIQPDEVNDKLSLSTRYLSDLPTDPIIRDGYIASIKKYFKSIIRQKVQISTGQTLQYVTIANIGSGREAYWCGCIIKELSNKTLEYGWKNYFHLRIIAVEDNENCAKSVLDRLVKLYEESRIRNSSLKWSFAVVHGFFRDMIPTNDDAQLINGSCTSLELPKEMDLAIIDLVDVPATAHRLVRVTQSLTKNGFEVRNVIPEKVITKGFPCNFPIGSPGAVFYDDSGSPSMVFKAHGIGHDKMKAGSMNTLEELDLKSMLVDKKHREDFRKEFEVKAAYGIGVCCDIILSEHVRIASLSTAKFPVLIFPLQDIMLDRKPPSYGPIRIHWSSKMIGVEYILKAEDINGNIFAEYNWNIGHFLSEKKSKLTRHDVERWCRTEGRRGSTRSNTRKRKRTRSHDLLD
ncbi:hypothetical protein AAMO2058_001406400 [Amorphochlora amoebiformis]